LERAEAVRHNMSERSCGPNGPVAKEWAQSSMEADLRNGGDNPENDRLMRVAFLNGSMIPTADLAPFLHSALHIRLHDDVAGRGL
jgi:hypothetical protein